MLNVFCSSWKSASISVKVSVMIMIRSWGIGLLNWWRPFTTLRLCQFKLKFYLSVHGNLMNQLLVFVLSYYILFQTNHYFVVINCNIGSSICQISVSIYRANWPLDKNFLQTQAINTEKEVVFEFSFVWK